MRNNHLAPHLKTILVLVLISIAGIVAGVWYSKYAATETAGSGASTQSRVLEEPKALTEFTLTKHDATSLGLDDLRGKWSFLFFGYTHCPDICPATLAELSRTFKKGIRAFPELSDSQAIFVSVDPERDTPEKIATYVQYFDADFIGSTGTQAQLNALTKQLGVKYSRGPESVDGYAMNHTAAMLLIDPQARYYAYFIPPYYAEEVFQHFLNIRNHYVTSQ